MADKELCVQTHTAYIYDRGARTRLDKLNDISRVRWERKRDATAEATIRLSALSCDQQAEKIERARSKRHELVIFRGKDRVFEGPLWRIGDQATGGIEFVAKDVTQYLFGTPMSKAWSNAFPNAAPVTTRLEQIINYELATDRIGHLPGGLTFPILAWENLDPPANILPYLQVHHWPNEAETTAVTRAFEMTIGAHLQEKGRTGGIDWTAVGRAIHIWDTSRSLGRTRMLTEADFFGPIIVTEYGADHTQSAYVVGEDGVLGEAHNLEFFDYYGPWAQVDAAYNEEGTVLPSQTELNSQARRNASGRSPVPLQVRVPDNSSIRLNESLTINQLVAGVQIPVLATLNARKVSQLQKLDSLVVTETADGETVQVTMSPTTRPDDDVEET